MITENSTTVTADTQLKDEGYLRACPGLSSQQVRHSLGTQMVKVTLLDEPAAGRATAGPPQERTLP